jgi:hypothetical protein
LSKNKIFGFFIYVSFCFDELTRQPTVREAAYTTEGHGTFTGVATHRFAIPATTGTAASPTRFPRCIKDEEDTAYSRATTTTATT